jgi:hypothetical protein
MRSLIVVLFSLAFSASANANTQKAALAGEIFDKTVALQAEPLIERMLTAMAREKKLAKEVIAIHREFQLRMFQSAEYRQAYVDAYSATYTEDELHALVDLANHPGFKIFLAKSQRITEMTYPTFVALMNKNRPELEQRLRDVKIE